MHLFRFANLSGLDTFFRQNVMSHCLLKASDSVYKSRCMYPGRNKVSVLQFVNHELLF